MNGEWWIVGGSAMFADGDVGDFNHEGYVIQSVSQEIAETVDSMGLADVRNPECVDIEKVLADVGGALVAEMVRSGKGLPDEDEVEVGINYLISEGIATEEAISTARGIGDARLYGMKHLGWKRVKGNNVETWHLTASDLSDIASGLGEILTSEDGDDFSFNIEVASSRKFFEEVPILVIESGNLSGLHEYLAV